MGRSVATYYDILRVGRGADPEGVRAAYRRLAQKYHPDKLPNNNSDAVRVMAMLNEAYAVLSDPDQRARYDRRIGEAKAGTRRAKRRAVAPIDVPTANWPWYLLFATIAFAAASFGTALYKTLVPGVAVAVAVPAVQVQAPAKPAKN
jgi:curved DNA-binding protein CbpA